MYNGGKIIIGLIIFAFIMTLPIWYNLASDQDPSLKDYVIATKGVKGKDRCVLPKEEMLATHMDVLDQWRDLVVRDGERIHTTPDGRRFNRSLSYINTEVETILNTSYSITAEGDTNSTIQVKRVKAKHLKDNITAYSCIECHSNKEQFCDRCHTYMSVDPYCWDCHIIPEPQLMEVAVK
ncbi:hypothetical protein K9N50_01950 [bacterium]|nr:hypothetical protein [bacterium]